MKKRVVACLLVVCVVSLLFGCTEKGGQVVDDTQVGKSILFHCLIFT